MHVTIRKGQLGSAPALFVYRPRERSQSLAHAHETHSGMWIVSLPNLPLDVACDLAEARAMLLAHFDTIAT